MLFERNYQRYIVNVTTKKVHWGLEREVIDFEESLPETRWGVEKYESHKRCQRTPWGFRREFVKQSVRDVRT